MVLTLFLRGNIICEYIEFTNIFIQLSKHLVLPFFLAEFLSFCQDYKSVSKSKTIMKIHKLTVWSLITRLSATWYFHCILFWIHIYYCSYTAQTYLGYIWSAGLRSYLGCQIFVNHLTISITINSGFLPLWSKWCYH